MNGKATLNLAWMAVAILGVVAFAGSAKAEAYDHHHHRHNDRNRVGIGINLGGPRYTSGVERRYVEGHYETRYEAVLVEPARCERRWVPDACETRYDHHGRPYTVCVRRGYWSEQHIPARYETRAVSVWVPGYYQDVPVVYERRSGPSFNIGGFFKF